jgi:hypothetical protein
MLKIAGMSPALNFATLVPESSVRSTFEMMPAQSSTAGLAGAVVHPLSATVASASEDATAKARKRGWGTGSTPSRIGLETA